MAAIKATEATFTASKKAENSWESRIFFTKGFNKATKTKEGRNIPIVLTNAPIPPFI